MSSLLLLLLLLLLSSSLSLLLYLLQLLCFLFRFGGTAFTLKGLFSGITQSFYTERQLAEVSPFTLRDSLPR